MSQNSLKAFQDISEELPEKRRAVYLMLEENPNSTFYQIAFKLSWNVNKVSNRMNELANSGLIKKTGEEQRGKFIRDKFSVIADVNEIIQRQNELYAFFIDTKSQLEADHHRCETKQGKALLIKRINYLKNKISNLKTLSI
jgi:Mn-dependent DtxR family transcriptional regulator